MNQEKNTNGPSTPFEILGVAVDASDQEVREAYLVKIREHPPERDPDQFEMIRDAYEVLRTSGARMMYRLDSIQPEAPLSEILGGAFTERAFLGPERWLKAMEERVNGD